MGWNIRSIVEKAFRHYSNIAYTNRLSTPDLFSRTPMICAQILRCRARASSVIHLDETVVVIKDGSRIKVWSGNGFVGEISSEDADDLCSAFESEDRACDIGVGTIVEETGIDGFFNIRIEERSLHAEPSRY
jgi:hypothetical protein